MQIHSFKYIKKCHIHFHYKASLEIKSSLKQDYMNKN